MTEIASTARRLDRRLLTSGVIFGVGVAAFVDETVFHQLLHWHHFYDLSTPAVGLVADGIFHATGWFLAVAGLFLFADVRRRGGEGLARWWPAVFVGRGAFQLYDGTIQQKLLRTHQTRYPVVPLESPHTSGEYPPVANLAAYDVVWNVVAVVLIAVGAFVWHRSTKRREAGRA